MALFKRPLGDYWQLLQKEGLLIPRDGLPLDVLNWTVELVTCDSQRVVPGSLFIVKGAKFKGEYLTEATRKGAFVYLSEEPWPEGELLTWLQVTDARRAMGLLADIYYDRPSQKLSVIGITGTKGKTSTAYFLKAILDDYLGARGKESGLISTIETYDGAGRAASRLTTPEPLELEEHLYHAQEAGLEYVTMECSSQGLKYDRMDGVRLAAAVFLNIGVDHISPVEHPDFEDYFASKLRIFEHSDLGIAALDCDRAEEVMKAAARCHRVISFSRKDPGAEVYGYDIRREGGETLFEARTPRYAGTVRLGVPGRFNVDNALAAMAVCEGLGIPMEHVLAGLERARVPGRMEVFSAAGGELTAVVDFAHNGMSLEAVLSELREAYPGRELTVVFGCTGKAADRREGMAKAAARWADRIFLTEDDPENEPVERICAHIGEHLKKAGREDYQVVIDRPEAIRMALTEAKRPAVVLLAGKGVETRQKRKDGLIPVLSDIDITKSILKELEA